MKTKKRVLPALMLSLFAGFTAPTASSAQFSGVYVFGDSLSDAGIYRGVLAGLGLPASVVSQLGRFTTNPGPVWSELVSQYYGVTPGPSNVSSGNIFAQGGARVTAPSASTPTGFPQRPVSTQIDEFLARNSGAADPGALYAIWAGGNDFLQNSALLSAGAITSAQLQTNVLGAATDEIAQIARLKAAGARYILVFGLPDIGGAPAVAAQGAASVAGATAISAGYNTTLFTGLQSAGIKVIPVDVFSLLTEVKANAAAFGFTNTTGIACGPFPPITTSGNAQFCLPTNLVAPNADQTYLFADGVHPTTATHRIIANFVESLIEGPTQYSLLAEAPLRTRASHIRTLNEGLATGNRAEIGKFTAFAAVDGGKFDIDSSTGNTGVRTDIKSASIGVTARASEAVTLGIAFGQSKDDGNFGLGAGAYDTHERVYSLFGSLKMGGLYGTGVVSVSNIDFNNMRRTFNLGQVVRTANAETKGSNASASFTAGYDFAIGRLAIGPTIGVTSQNVDVNGFDETNGGSAGLRIYNQKRRSEVWSAGGRASFNLGQWTPWLRVTADKERKDDARFVSATPLSMAAIGSTYDIPAYQGDTSFVTSAIGINGFVTDNIALSFAYTKISARSGIKEDGLSALIAIKF
ncbi:MAG: autotransporter domain-containing protein [Usitatibacter sp.]